MTCRLVPTVGFIWLLAACGGSDATPATTTELPTTPATTPAVATIPIVIDDDA